MKNLIKSLVLILALNSCVKTKIPPVDYVNPFIDSHNSRWLYFSSACRPFGMVSLSPDTDTKSSWSSGYLYDSKYIRCFSHIHAWQMSGIAVMPITGEMKGHLGMDQYKSAFSHEGEEAKPGYHKITLDDYDIDVELTSTCRVGLHKYVFNNDQTRYILIDAGAYLAHGSTKSSKVEKVSDTQLHGYAVMSPTIRRPKPVKVYFVIEFDQPFSTFGGWQNKTLIEEEIISIEGVNAGAYVSYNPSAHEINMKVAISYTSIKNAKMNMENELNQWDFDKVKQESYREWNDWLSRIEVNGGTEKQKIKFYTDLWHSLLGRRIVSDVDGSYIDNTGKLPFVRQVALNSDGNPRFPHYNSDAWWGTHWSLNILWGMVYPELMDGFVNTMVDMYQNGGLLPRGPSGGNYTFVMIGDHSAPFVTSAYNKGIRNYDVDKAYEGLRKNAFVGGTRDHAGYEHQYPAYGGGMKYYVEQGWVPEGIKAFGMHLDGAAMTLEYSYQDWCLAQMAKNLGKDNDYKLFMKRSFNYKNLWNPETGLMHPREIDGSWIRDFEPIAEKQFTTRGFCESNSAIYTNFVPHDIAGLAQLFGGNEEYVEFLNSSFEKAQVDFYKTGKKTHAANWVDYGNQPGTGMAHLFNHAGAPWLSQKWVRIIKDVYSDITPYNGYQGDEDQGQMGSLGVLMAMGLFEVDGGSAAKPTYEITSPIFDKIIIHLDKRYYKGKSFTIKTENNSAENIYIQSARLNGKTLNNCWFYHDDLTGGGELRIQLGKTPNKKWGVEELPPSMSRIASPVSVRLSSDTLKITAEKM